MLSEKADGKMAKHGVEAESTFVRVTLDDSGLVYINCPEQNTKIILNESEWEALLQDAIRRKAVNTIINQRRKEMAERLYLVEDDENQTIVRAISEARALTHVVKGQFSIRKASADDVANYMGMGGTIEVADVAAPPLSKEDTEASKDAE